MGADGITYTTAEFNTIITMLGCLCATVQLASGWYAAFKKKKIGMIKTNDILFRAHRAFGSFATTLYFLGLFAGVTGFIGALIFNIPPFEGTDPSFNIHVWPSFAVVIVIIWKSYLSYFKKSSIYKKGKWLGIATFIIPFMFVYNHALLMKGSLGEIVLTSVGSVIGVLLLASGVAGYLLKRENWWERLLLIGGAIMLLMPGWVTDITGIGLGAAVLLRQRRALLLVRLRQRER